MAENEYFTEALKSMCAGMAYVEAVKHLHDSGLSPEEIQKKCLYPVSLDQVNEVIRKYETYKQSPESDYEIIESTGAYGRRSFIKVQKSDNRQT